MFDPKYPFVTVSSRHHVSLLTTALLLAMAVPGQASAQESSDGSAAQPPKSDTYKPGTLDTIKVRAKRDQAETDFKADRSDTTSRSGNTLLDTPAAVTVITSKVLETQQATSVVDALSNASGVVVQRNAQGTPSFSIRGFGDTYNNASTNVTSNGVSDVGGSNMNTFGIERIEVLKGPQAILSGARTLGGSVNIVTKKPQAETTGEALFQVGSHGDSTLGLDVGGALSEDQRLTFRTISSWAFANGSEGGYKGRKDYFMMPQIRWKDENTDFLFGVSMGRQFVPANRYTFAWDGRLQPTPKARLGQIDNGVQAEQKRAFYSLEHRFNDVFTLVSKLDYDYSTTDLQMQTPLTVLSTASGLALYTPTNNVTDFHSLSGDHYLRAEFLTGPVSQTLSVGVNHSEVKQQIDSYEGGMSPISIYSVVPSDFPSMERGTPSYIYNINIKQTGLYAQDLLAWKGTTLLLSVRHTRLVEGPQKTAITGGTTTVIGKDSDSKTLYSAGIVQRVLPWASVYANYSQGFDPQFGTPCGGQSLPRQTRNKEAGAKFDLMNGRLSLTTDVFEVKDRNAAEYQNANACYDFVSSQRTRGAELDLQGQLAPGWSAIFNYTHAKAEDLSGDNLYIPARPHNSASLWTVYDFQDGPLKNFGAGLGVTAHDASYGDKNNSFQVPGAASVDTRFYYNHDQWQLTVGIKNVFDRLMYGQTTSGDYIPVLDGRTYMATLRLNFL